jgi:hypothetical protein
MIQPTRANQRHLRTNGILKMRVTNVERRQRKHVLCGRLAGGAQTGGPSPTCAACAPFCGHVPLAKTSRIHENYCVGTRRRFYPRRPRGEYFLFPALPPLR